MMCKVYIVEDEPPILRDIILKVESLGQDYQILGSAANGEDALADIRNNKPDVVITDINMPIMNGLTLIELVKKELPNTVCIILSGYQEFDYARRALQLGVNDYIVKPVSREALAYTLNKAKVGIDGVHNDKMRSTLHSILNYQIPKDGIVLEPFVSFDLLYLCVNHPMRRVAESNSYHEQLGEFWSKIKLDTILAAATEANSTPYWIMDGSVNNEKLILLANSKQGEEAVQQIWQSIITLIEGRSWFLTATMGRCVESSSLAVEVELLRSLTRARAKFGINQLLDSGLAPNDHELSFNLHASEEKKLIVLCQNSQHKQLLDTTRQLLLHWEQQGITSHALEDNLIGMLNVIVRNSYLIEPVQGYNTERIIQAMILNNNNMAALVEEFIAAIEQLLTASTIQKKTDYEEVVHDICSFIESNYSSKLTLRDLAQQVGLSESHLCKLFKRYKDESPIDYLLKIRIEQSKRLMKDYPEMMFKEIAEIVGFSDQYYFSRIFRSHTGHSPSEYRMVIQINH